MPTLIPFNLEAAKAGAPLITRDGRPAKFIGFADECTKGYQLAAVLDGELNIFAGNGQFYIGGHESNHPSDLFMAPVKHERWINIYPDGQVSSFTSRKYADSVALSSRVACIQITYAEGEGL